MGIHESEALSEGVFLNQSIGVEQQDVFARALPDGLVVGDRKTGVALVGD
jgi:hypothetical protein